MKIDTVIQLVHGKNTYKFSPDYVPKKIEQSAYNMIIGSTKDYSHTEGVVVVEKMTQFIK